MSEGPPERVTDPARLAALRRSGALGLVGDQRLQRINRLATALLGTPVSLVTLVGADRQVFAGQVGLAEPWASRGETPLSHSFCQHVVGDDTALVVRDARRDVRLRDNRAIDALDVVAYLGVPLRDTDGEVLGSFCVIDGSPRQWTPDEVALVEDLAALAQTELHQHGAEDEHALAHDVRSTLHGVVGGARTLAGIKGLDDTVRTQLLEVVERQARHLETLLTRMLGDADARSDPLAVVDVRQLVDDVVEDYEVTGIATVHHRRDGAAQALGDPTALRRCLTNLIDNALKHGGSAVEVATTSNGETTRVTVTDDGPGIPRDQHELVFERGHRGSTGTPGDGLGLATVRELTRAMGGEVTVSSESGRGTTFVLELPTGRAAPPEGGAARR